MTQTFTAQVKAFSDRAIRNFDLIAKDAIQITFAKMTMPQPGVRYTGGAFEEGKVPLDTGYLLGTAFCEINGTQTATGTVAGEGSTPPDFAMGIAGMKLGDIVTGAFQAPYARRLNYGYSGTDSLGRTYNVPGRFFVNLAAQGWQQAVSDAASKFK